MDHSHRRPKTVKVTVYSGRNLTSRKGNTDPLAWVTFGFGKVKSCTAQIRDRNAQWNEESTFSLTDSKTPLKFNIKDKDDTIGQIIIPLADIPCEEHFLKWIPLGAHKNNPNPSGEICIDCWVENYYEEDESLKEKKTIFNKTLNRLTGGKSPEMIRKFSPSSSKKLFYSPGNSSLKGSISIEDISSHKKKFNRGLLAPMSYNSKEYLKPILIRKTTSTLDIHDDTTEIPSYTTDSKNTSPLPVIKEQNYPPKITDIIPRSGPSSGNTLIQITGRYLGSSKDDITRLSVGGCNCLATLEYYTSNKIMCTTSQSYGKGPITISTRSGGVSSSKIMFEFVEEELDSTNESLLGATDNQNEDPGPSSDSFNRNECEKDEIINQLHNEIDGLKYDNRELREYIDRLVLYLMNKYPDALESARMYHR